nr:hypothetical protein GCM10020092_058960 [Actinoplanes digitatis]
MTVAATSAAAENTTATFSATATGHTAASITATVLAQGSANARFTQLYTDIKNSANGYFSPEGVPYHSIETLIDEAPDQGHETTSEAFSYWLWLEAEYGQVTGNWSPFNSAWTTMEKYIIPSHADQPTNANYNASKPATYAAEHPLPSSYPSQLDTGVSVGTDPLAAELKSAYGTDDIYGMHWLLDVDNVYGFGHCGDGTSRVTYINTFQRGPQESTWETVPQPSCDTFKHGGPNGYLDLFTKDASYAKQWKYTNAPDADSRAVQAAYWANQWATAQGKQSQISTAVANAAKMGDYLRYSFYDKYFKQPGCTSTGCPARHRQERLQQPDVLVLRLGRRIRHQRRLGVAHRLEHQPLRIPEPDGGVRAEQHHRAGAQVTDRQGRLAGQPQPAARVLPVAAVVRGRDRRRRDEQLERQLLGAAVRHPDVLRPGLRRGAGVRRPAVQPVVRHADLVAGAAGRVLLHDR